MDVRVDQLIGTWDCGESQPNQIFHMDVDGSVKVSVGGCITA